MPLLNYHTQNFLTEPMLDNDLKKYSHESRIATSKERLLEGIICGVDAKQFWLLSWFLENLEKTNTYPITIFDFGLNSLQRSWIEKRYSLQKISGKQNFDCFEGSEFLEFREAFEEKYGLDAWQDRSLWFKKPLACLKSPYLRTLWLDLDCEVLGDLKPVFGVLKDSFDLCLALDPKQSCDYPVYNSGVIGFAQGSSTISKWAEKVSCACLGFRGDQDVLSHIIHEEKSKVYQLDPKYNYSFSHLPDASIVICHYMGESAKNLLRTQLSISRL